MADIPSARGRSSSRYYFRKLKSRTRIGLHNNYLKINILIWEIEMIETFVIISTELTSYHASPPHPSPPRTPYQVILYFTYTPYTHYICKIVNILALCGHFSIFINASCFPKSVGVWRLSLSETSHNFVHTVEKKNGLCLRQSTLSIKIIYILWKAKLLYLNMSMLK